MDVPHTTMLKKKGSRFSSHRCKRTVIGLEITGQIFGFPSSSSSKGAEGNPPRSFRAVSGTSRARYRRFWTSDDIHILGRILSALHQAMPISVLGVRFKPVR